MTLSPLLPRLAPLALALASAPLAAQEFAPSAEASPAACAAITTDAARLACYDRQFGRTRRPLPRPTLRPRRPRRPVAKNARLHA